MGTATAVDSLTSAARAERAFLLAAVAILGLVVGPLLHAEQHRREDHDEEVEALVEAWTAGSTDPLEKLAFALAHTHGAQRSRSPEQPGHSHGPEGGGPHGAGTLAHFSLALHAAPGLPQLAVVRPAHAAPVVLATQLSSTLSYLVPEWSQGPPVAC